RIRIGFKVIDEATHAPRPGAQRTPIFGTARLALVGQADDPFAQPAVVRLNAAGIDRAVGPALVERLLLPRVRASLAAEAGEPKLQDDRLLARGMLGHGEAGLNGDLDLRKGAVVNVADQRLGHRGDAAAFALDGLGDLPLHLGDVLGNFAVDLALKIREDFR